MQMKSGPSTPRVPLDPIVLGPLASVASEHLRADLQFLPEVIAQHGFGRRCQFELRRCSLPVVARREIAASLRGVGAEKRQDLCPRLFRLVNDVIEKEVTELKLRGAPQLQFRYFLFD